MTLKMDIDALHDFLAAEFPQVKDDFRVVSLAPMEAMISMQTRDAHLRPGGTVSGPTLFSLADVAVYLVLMAMIGPKALAVTTNASVDFMRKPAAGRALLADVRLLKLGRVLAVGDVMIRSEGDDRPVARATLTYSIPPARD